MKQTYNNKVHIKTVTVMFLSLIFLFSCNGKQKKEQDNTVAEVETIDNVVKENHTDYANPEIAYVKNAKLYFYNIEDKAITEFTQEKDAVFNCTFHPEENKLYYTVVKNGNLWLKQADFDDDTVKISLLKNFNINEKKCITDTYSEKSNLLYYQNKIYLIHSFLWEMYAFEKLTAYDLTTKKLDENPTYYPYNLETTVFQFERENPKLKTKKEQLVYTNQGVSTILSDKIEMELVNADEFGLDNVYHQFRFSADKSKLLFGAITSFGDLADGPICIADTDGKNQQKLTEDGLASERKPTWLANQLVFIRQEKKTENEWIGQLCFTNAENNTYSVIDENVDYFTARELKPNTIAQEADDNLKPKHEDDLSIKHPKYLVYEGDLFYKSPEYIVSMADDDFYVYNKKLNKRYHFNTENIENTIELYYKGVKENYLILDDGTGNIRTLIIIDMSTGKIVKDIVYAGEIELNDELYYWREIESLPESVTPPPCDKMEGVPDEQYGYVEKCAFNFETLTIKQLNEYECRYFE